MLMTQILMSPEGDAGGGPAGGDMVTISREELDLLRVAAEAATRTMETTEAQAGAAETLLARENLHLREIAEKDRKTAELQQAYRSALRDREIATALVGKPLIQGAAMQLIQLWRDDFDVVDDGTSIRVLARDGQNVEHAIAERLVGPQYAHFCLPTSRGGTGARGQNRSGSPAPASPGPRTLGEAAVMRWRDAEPASSDSSMPVWGRRR